MAGVHKEVFNQKFDLRHPSSGIWQVKGTEYQIIWYSVLYFAIDTFIMQSLGRMPNLQYLCLLE